MKAKSETRSNWSDKGKHGFWRNFLNGLAHAFKVEKGTEDELSAEELETLEILAERVVRAGMAVPAIVFLESMRPMGYLGSQLMLFFRPIIDTAVDGVNVATSPFGMNLSMEFYNRLQAVLEKRACIEALIMRIDKRCEKIPIADKRSSPKERLG